VIDKRALVAALLERIEKEKDLATRVAKDAADAATHEENRPENDKDMRSTEASYIARGQAERVRTLDHAVKLLASMEVKDFADGGPIAASALVDVASKGTRATYLLVPAAGGMRLEWDGAEVQTLAAASPLGKALLGLSEGDEAEIQTPQGARVYEITRVR
jgi:transcription elongation GreA/GreB family factor